MPMRVPLGGRVRWMRGMGSMLDGMRPGCRWDAEQISLACGRAGAPATFPQRRFTRAEYDMLGKSGVLRESENIELMHGVLGRLARVGRGSSVAPLSFADVVIAVEELFG